MILELGDSNMKAYLPNKTEIATLLLGLGLGIALSLSGSLSFILLILWPIFFIAMPLLYIIGKRKINSNKESSSIELSPKNNKNNIND